mmetsp:Transcript_23064/g.64283  ORF Transcript_23064/g.64283 Transcript_23064/m.64283 type:complete len:186 (+) Transcript_23064:646-1203(+)
MVRVCTHLHHRSILIAHIATRRDDKHNISATHAYVHAHTRTSAQCANVMYRLTHNQLQKLKTKVFWLLIGTNDFSALQCSSDAVTAGNIAIVQQLQKLRPKARVVINSILPRDSAYMDLIRQTNKRLNCYAQQTENVDYFDATSIFYDDAKEELQHLPDELHPDAEGARAWGKQIVQRVEEILKE